MKRIAGTVLLALALCAPAAIATAQQDKAEQMYQQALYEIEGKGNYEKAIGIFKDIVQKYPKNQPLAAKSLLRMGQCYEKLGKDEAKKAYERIIKEYASQPDVVAEARARLAALSAATIAGGSPAARMLISNKESSSVNIASPGAMAPHPDGRRIAYLQLSGRNLGIAVRDLETGEEEQVVADRPSVSSSSLLWSPNGKRLAFKQEDLKTKSSSIKILELASHEIVSVPGLDAKGLRLLDWSRDGRFLLCSHERNTLELVTVKDGTIKTLADSVWQGQRASFSPDGRYVAYASGRHRQEIAYTQSISGGSRHRIAEAQKGQSNAYLHPLWSPDGNVIAYQQPDGIWVVPVTNGIASGVPRLAFRTDLPRWPVAWTEAGGFYILNNGEHFIAHQVTVDPTKGRLADAEPLKIPDAPGDLSDFAWAPDPQHIIYTGWGNRLRVYATDSKTMTSYDVGSGMLYRPSRSPNNGEVLFEIGDPPSQTAYVKVLDINSGKIRDLFPPIKGFAFSFSKDGTKMTYVRRSASGAEVIVRDSGQSDGRVLAAGMMAIPEMSPKGDQVLLIRKGEATSEYGGSNGFSLWVMAADSSSNRRIASAWGIANAKWDPSGRFIAYLARPESGADARDLRIVEAATGAQCGNLLLAEPTGRIQLTDWSGDGKSIGFFATDMWWEHWVIKDLQQGVR